MGQKPENSWFSEEIGKEQLQQTAYFLYWKKQKQQQQREKLRKNHFSTPETFSTLLGRNIESNFEQT